MWLKLNCLQDGNSGNVYKYKLNTEFSAYKGHGCEGI